jgi:ABC-type transport system involved in cytochrome c biogenesis permease component
VSPASRRKMTPGVPLRFRSDQRGLLLACIFFPLFSPPLACSLVGRPSSVCVSGPG